MPTQFQRPNFDRIRPVMDVDRLEQCEVAIIGLGGAVTLACDLARCAIPRFKLFDFDIIEPVNVARQDHMASNIGLRKVDAVAALLAQINPAVEVETFSTDFCTLEDLAIDELFAHTDCILACTDSFAAQARANQVALRLAKKAVFVGLYEGGQAGEVVFFDPAIHDCCLRCLCSKRYEAYERPGGPPPITSRGASIFDIRLPDAIAGMITVGLLTQGADNRFGRLIDQLGDRQFLQIKVDPDFTWNGRDIFREQLRIPADCNSYFTWVTIARSDPDRGQLPCADCERFRGHDFVATKSGWLRLKPDETEEVDG
jgi:hypothetical protein